MVDTLSEAETQQHIIEAGPHQKLLFDFEVSGDQSYSGHVLTAKRLVFKPNARLIFGPAVVRRTANLFIFAQEIVSEDNEAPGTITWADLPPGPAADRGFGHAGVSNAAAENTPGGAGGEGPSGALGEAGWNAPSLTCIVGRIATALKVDMRGEDGGPGGTGGGGGAGGQGGRGRNASQIALGCKHGAGDGAVGGPGGRGGVGGEGGAGGNGGTFTLIAAADAVPEITRMLLVDLSGGAGGAGGGGGPGGAGGPGGPGGAQSLPWCQGNGGQGPGGPAGAAGDAGVTGRPGAPGSYFVGGLTAADLNAVLA